MSWSIKAIGTRKAVKARVAADKYLPEEIRTAIVAIIDDSATHIAPGVRVEGYGHQGGGSQASIGKLEVEPVEFAPEPAPSA